LYANKAYGVVTESAANTLTFAQIQTNVSTFDKIAWVVHSLEWYIPVAELNKLAAADDIIQLALVASSSISSLLLNNPGVIDLFEISLSFATSVGFARREQPYVRSFATLPSGGIIISPAPIYLAVKGTSLATALVNMACRIYYTTREMSADEYLELVDFYRITGA
jgi:hypothetical protein